MAMVTVRLVKNILTVYPTTRNDDYLLWLKVLQMTDSEYLERPLIDFLKNAKHTKFAHFETVSRLRRKIQEEYPELQATETTRRARNKREAEWREFARQHF